MLSLVVGILVLLAGAIEQIVQLTRAITLFLERVVETISRAVVALLHTTRGLVPTTLIDANLPKFVRFLSTCGPQDRSSQHVDREA